MEKITVTRTNIADIIAAWWAEYQADPAAFTEGPDRTGEASADTFLRIAREKGIGES